MTLEKLTYDLLEILTRFKITQDTRITKRYLQQKIAQYRAEKILFEYRDEADISSSWLQNLGLISPTKVSPGDDPNISGCDCILGRFTIPPVVRLPNDLGVYRVSSACGTNKYYPISFDRFTDLVPGSIRSRFKYFFKINTSLYLFPYISEGKMAAILEDPMDAWVIKSENVTSGNLVVGTVYKVVSGNILHNSVRYQKAQTFTAVNTIFGGAGLVQLVNQKVAMSIQDPYPMDHSMTSYVLLKILTQDFAIAYNEIADIINDGQDQNLRTAKGSS